MSYATTVLADSPAAYWRLGDTGVGNVGGATWADSSGNGRGLVQNATNPMLQTTGLLTGDSDKAASHNGGRWAVAPWASWMDQTDFTVELVDNMGSNSVIFFSRYTGTNSTSVWMLWRNVFTLTFSCFVGGTRVDIAQTTGGSATATTYHHAANVIGTAVTLYQNGAQVGSGTLPGAINSPGATGISVGADVLGNNSGAGIWDEVAFYSPHITPTRITAHYTASITAPPAAKNGTAAGAYDWAGSTTTGKRLPKATATGAYNWAGSTTGKRAPKATTAGTYNWAGTATGVSPFLGVKQGTAAGGYNWAAVGATGNRPRAGTATGGYRWAGTAFGGGSGPPISLDTLHWTFTERATGETWTMPINPNSMTGLPRIKQFVTAGTASNAQDARRLRTFQSATTADRLEWSGVILSAAHYQDLLTWSDKPGVILVTDHLQRSFEVIFQAFTPETKAGRRPYDPKRHYTMSTLFLRRLT